jgi:hypothetical protein
LLGTGLLASLLAVHPAICLQALERKERLVVRQLEITEVKKLSYLAILNGGYQVRMVGAAGLEPATSCV